MSKGVADSAVGAILEIPPQALNKIKEAEDAIKRLANTSLNAANSVRTHWGKIAPDGLQKFIDKLAEAKKAMEKLGINTLNVNTQPLEQNMESATKKVETDVDKISKALQSIAQMPIDTSNIKTIEAAIRDAGYTFQQIEKLIKNWEAGRKVTVIDSSEAEVANRTIEKLKEFIALKKQSQETIQNKQAEETTKQYLSEQKQILTDILNIRKQISANQISASRKFQTGGDTSEESKNITNLLSRLAELNAAYRELKRTKGESLTEQGQKDAENNQLRHELALLKETNAAREKLNQNISRGNELANQAKLKSAGLGSTDDSIYQRTITNLYQDQIKVLKDIGKVRADIASEGRRASESETEKLTLLAQKYRELQTAISQMSGKYTKIDANVQSNFEAERARQIVENTILKEQAERKYQETLAKTQQILAGAKDLTSLWESLGKFRQEEQRMFDELVRIQNLINQLRQERIDIQFNLKADTQAKIEPLIDRLRELRELTKQPLSADKLREYYREIDILKEKINQATTEAQRQAASNPALLGNQEQIEALVSRYNTLSAEMSKVGIEANKLGQAWVQQNEANQAIEQQAQRVQMLEQRLQNLNAIWERLKATNQAYNADGTLTDKGKRFVAIQDEVKNEIMLRRMTASEARKYEEKKTADAKREADKRIADAKREAKETRDALSQQKQQSISTPQGAIDYAKNARSLRELTDAYNNLKKVMANTDPKSQAWKDLNTQLGQTGTKIAQIKSKMNELNSQSSKTAGIMGQLQGRIAAAFSVGAIMGFIKKMVEVRAQFELQRVALGAIIQDRDEANKIFTQVQNMALESPFNIMQLEKATKQIAAFGFETKKIVPTMKMFADISAGLGVEIDRLVLVMGHLKARNFLEGTMVRQFTNMGFNVLGELSKYYTELEGKMVSVGEVQDRVKKKMVSFEDVEEVLKRVTSAGGMFYDMQKKQANSLWGQMQRITDAYDLMLNEIGQSNDGIIKIALTAIRNLINQWRVLKPFIVAATVALGSYMAIAVGMKAIPLLLTNIKNGFMLMGAAIGLVSKKQAALNVTMMSNPYAAAISAILTIITLLVEWYNYQDKLTESLDRVRNEGIGNMYDLIYQYKNLSDTVRDSTKTYEERKSAMEDLNRIFGEILPKEMLSISYIKSQKEGYEEATEAIKAYSAEKTKENLKSEVENIVGKDIQDAVGDLADGFANLANQWQILPEKMPKDTFRTIAQTMITEISEEVKNGVVPIGKAIGELQKRMKDRLRNFISEEDIDSMFFQLLKPDAYGENIFDDLIDSLQKFQDQTKGIDIGIEGILQSDEVTAQRENFDELTKSVSAYNLALEQLKDIDFEALGGLKQDEQGHILNFTPDIMAMDAINSFNAALDEVNEKGKILDSTFTFAANNVNQALQSDADMAVAVSDNIQKSLIAVLDNIIAVTTNPAVKKFFMNLRDEIAKTKLTPIQEDVKRTMELIAQKSGLQMKIFDKLKLTGFTSYDEVRKAAKSAADEAAENAKRVREITLELIGMKYAAADAKRIAEARVGTGDKSAEDYEEESKAFMSLAKNFGYYEKAKKETKKKEKKGSKGTDEELKKLQDLGKAIKDVNTEYEELRKSYDKKTSNKMIEDMYSKVFKELGSDIKKYYKDGTYDMESLIKAYRILQDQVKATTKDRKKYRSEIERDIDKTEVKIKLKIAKESEDKLKADLDEMFANYELTKELKKIGVSVDLTYMVGGKPTTKEDIRNEIERLRKEGGGSEDAENRIKILEDAEKKLTQIELKEQKERLKNYEKYLKQMYSDRAKKMIEAYTDMKNMEHDFDSFIAKLQAEANQDGTTDERKQQIAEQIKSLKFQKAEAIKAVNEALNQNLAKLDWEQFKGSDVFTQLYQDTENLSKKGIDLLITKLKQAREALQSMDKVDYRAVREITNHIEKLQNVKLDTSSWGELTTTIKKAKETIGNVSLEDAQKNMIDAQSKIDEANIQIAQIQAIIDLKEQEGNEDDKIKNLSKEQRDLYNEDIDALREKLKSQQGIVDEQQKIVDTNEEIVDAYDEQRNAINKKIAMVEKLKEAFNKVYSSVVDVADALGNDTDMWADFGQAIADSVFSCITLTLQMQLMGIAANSSLGVIGWVATALQVVANLLVAIFKQHDKRLEKKIEGVQARVDKLSKSFEELQKSIERAFTIGNENRLTEQALDNIEKQKSAYNEMIALEEAKKKTDDDKIKDYKEKLEELAEAEEELYEKRHEKWGSTNDGWGEANNWVDAWLDSFKETGDGLDALNESWDEFYENLVKKQAVSKVMGARMDKWIKQINDAIDSGADEYGMVDLYKQLGEKFKKEFGDANEWLKEFFEYAGIKGNGELILSDLQKGIQNITEPQAAAIESYLNSMRFAVFRHTEQLDTLIATIQMQYGSDAENPVVTELKGIRQVLDSIDSRLNSVIESRIGGGDIIRVG